MRKRGSDMNVLTATTIGSIRFQSFTSVYENSEWHTNSATGCPLQIIKRLQNGVQAIRIASCDHRLTIIESRLSAIVRWIVLEMESQG